MPIESLTSTRYWLQNDETIAQKFYISLCLLISAASDLAVALQLRDSNKLNWSATAGYYSMVHGSRLILFMGCGDFPTRHEGLVDFFSDGHDLQFNWFRNYDKAHSQNSNRNRSPIGIGELSTYYSSALNLQGTQQQFAKIGRILLKAKNLRNDSNYEALIMAHEHQHIRVSDDFRLLGNAMTSNALFIFDTAVNCFLHYLCYDRALESHRDTYRQFVSEYAQARIVDPIVSRCGSQYGEQIKSRILELFLGSIPITEQTLDAYSGLEERVSFDVFGPKAVLMRTFRDKVEELALEANLNFS
jgi:hypothetical protein